MKNLLAISLACSLPLGLAAEDPQESSMTLGTVNVLVIEESVPMAKDVLCARAGSDTAGDAVMECMAMHRAVLTARIQKVSALRERGRWM